MDSTEQRITFDNLPQAVATLLDKVQELKTLTENLFMDNYEDCDFLLSPEGQQALVDLHVDGITNYLNTF